MVGFGMKKLLLAAIISAFLAPHAGQADQAEVRRGAVFVENHCARCHATGTASESPLANAPPFRTLHRRYPIESLEEALGRESGQVTARCPSSNWTKNRSWISSSISDRSSSDFKGSGQIPPKKPSSDVTDHALRSIRAQPFRAALCGSRLGW